MRGIMSALSDPRDGQFGVPLACLAHNERRVIITKNTKVAISVTAVLIIAVIVLLGVVIGQRASDAPQSGADNDAVSRSAVRDDSHRLDDVPNASVTVVEFLDFECEACGAFYPYVEEVRKKYDGQITWVMRYFPLPSHVNSQNSAVAVEAAARQGALESMYSKMFETQAQWGESQGSQADLFRTYAQELGLDMVAYDADVADPDVLARVMSDFDGGRALGVGSTPSFFINDRVIELSSFEDLDAAIATELSQ